MLLGKSLATGNYKNCGCCKFQEKKRKRFWEFPRPAFFTGFLLFNVWEGKLSNFSEFSYVHLKTGIIIHTLKDGLRRGSVNFSIKG